MKINTNFVIGAFSALCLLAAPACDDSKKDAKKDDKKADAKKGDKKADDKKADAKADAKADEKKAAPADAKAEAKADGGEAAAAGGAEKLGVAECDDYIAQMSKCFEGMPEAARGAAKQGFDMTVKAWKDQVAANPEAKTALGAGCKAAMDGAAKAYPDCFKAE
ncbi:MAG: hypothetical protein K0V04_06640 [Deltaproteobacteria bacterium]|nr:hypothetical protein [Deltaproteobacteria bacterium]